MISCVPVELMQYTVGHLTHNITATLALTSTGIQEITTKQVS